MKPVVALSATRPTPSPHSARGRSGSSPGSGRLSEVERLVTTDTSSIFEPPTSATRRRGSVVRSLAVEPAAAHCEVEPSGDVSAFDDGDTFDDVDDGTDAFDVDGDSSSVRARSARGVGATTVTAWGGVAVVRAAAH